MITTLINFSGDVGAVDIDEETFRTLEAKRQEVVRSSLPDIKFNEAQLLLKAKNEIDRMINNSSAIQHKDSEGRLVYYAADTTGGLVGKKIHNDESGASFSGIGGFPHVVIGGKTYLNIVRPHEAVSLIGSNANDILVGGYEDDLLMGNDGEDTLDSGEGNDILKGGVGDDTLEGGEGDDTLEGGGGFDTYRADNGDTIIDSDGMGRVYLNGKLLTGGERNSKDSSIYKGSDGTIYIWGGDDLTVGGLTIKNFDGNGLGIKLADKNDKKPDVGAAERLGSPLVIDMNGDGARSVEQNRHYVYFDLDNNGFAERTGWADKDDALLVLDRNGNGTIDNGSELFGNYTALKTGGYAENGFEALKDFDENKDNVLTRDDPIWSQLQLWRDVSRMEASYFASKRAPNLTI